ncbi:MAG: O-antigen ligase family protein [Clostridia bacterium]|nr:O-antigen ligase family protein [Clostridia bacterium]
MAGKRKPLRAINDFFAKSIIITWLCAVTGAVYKKISASMFAFIFTSYDRMAAWFSRSKIVNFCKPKIKAEPKKTLSFKISRLYEQSLFCLVLDKIKWGILACQLNIAALFGITFGFSSALMLILKNFAFRVTQITWDGIVTLINPLMTSLCFIVVSILLIFVKKPLIGIINESVILSSILFDCLRLRKIPPAEYEKHTGMNAGVAVIFGILFGALSFFFVPSQIITVMCAAVVIIIVLCSPEAGVSIILFALPFVPTMWLVWLVCATLLSFSLKCFRRKRVVRVDGIDIWVSVFSIFIVAGGTISVDIASSVPKMLVYLCFLFMYFIVKNTVRTEILLKSCAASINISALLVAAIGIFQYFVGDVSTVWQDTAMFAGIPGRAVSTFENPNVLGEYLILVLPVIFAFFIATKNLKEKCAYFFVFMTCACCLIFTWSRGAWLGFTFAVIIFILFKSHEFLAGIILLSPALALGATFLLNQNIIDRILSIGDTADSSTMYRLNIWKGVFNMFRENGIFGIGIGEDAFAAVFPKYALAGTQTAPHTHSLYLQIVSEMGAFALVAFLVLCFAFFSHTFAYIHRTINAKDRTLATGFMCAIAAFLVQGFTDYVWYNYKIYLFFWIMLGLAITVFYISEDEQRRKFFYG